MIGLGGQGRFLERGPEHACLHHVGADIEFDQVRLVTGCTRLRAVLLGYVHEGILWTLGIVSGLDDIHDATVIVTVDATIWPAAAGSGAEQRERRLLEPMACHQTAHRRLAQQRRVAIEDQHGAVIVGQAATCLEDRIAGAPCITLHHVLEAVVAGLPAEMVHDVVVERTGDDTDILGRNDGLGQLHDIVDDRMVAERLQHPGVSRLLGQPMLARSGR